MRSSFTRFVYGSLLYVHLRYVISD